jgi:hypothetical protein
MGMEWKRHAENQRSRSFVRIKLHVSSEYSVHGPTAVCERTTHNSTAAELSASQPAGLYTHIAATLQVTCPCHARPQEWAPL